MVDMFSLKDRYKSSTTKPPTKSSTTITTTTTTLFDYTTLPKKIIKATKSYSAQHDHELSFEKGDFFHVVGRENDRHWYAVNNPLSNTHGLVPVAYFQVIDKSTRTMNAIQPTLPLDYQPYHHHQHQDPSTQQQQRCYGIVLYDFVAERQDELGCQADETIIVIAQSNKEWYVAKPIGRLGGPGLVPVSFVQLYDILTNHPVLLPTTAAPRMIPNLNEWKKQIQGYEAATIPLATNSSSIFYSIHPERHSTGSGGGLSLSSSNATSLSDQHSRRHHSSTSSCISSPSLLRWAPSPRHSYESSISPSSSSKHDHNEMTPKEHHLRHSQSPPLPPLPSSVRRTSIYHPSLPPPRQSSKVVDIAANSFISEDDQYWFVFYATVNNGKHRILYRTYDYFYQFHVRLLQAYPIEAGNGDKERILPMMPAPLDQVDDLITEQRREDLDEYCKKLLMLPTYLSESDLIQMDLFGLKKGDVETDYALKKGSRVLKSTNTTTTTTTQDVFHPSQPYEEKISTAAAAAAAAAAATTTFGGPIGLVKIKIIYKDDIFAVKISADCTMHELRQRIKDRLGGGTLGTMTYKNDTHHHPHHGPYLPLETEMDMEEAFILALQHGKLTIAVDDS